MEGKEAGKLLNFSVENVEVMLYLGFVSFANAAKRVRELEELEWMTCESNFVVALLSAELLLLLLLLLLHY